MNKVEKPEWVQKGEELNPVEFISWLHTKKSYHNFKEDGVKNENNGEDL